ncbi:MAG: CHAT domain-containing protein [Thermoanaerobaculia bacterium]
MAAVPARLSRTPEDAPSYFLMAETWKILVLAGLIGTCFVTVGHPATAAGQVPSVPAGQSFGLLKERGRLHSLTLNASHVYRVKLETGQLLSATFEQMGVDIHLDLFGPAGELLASIDSPNGSQGQEPVLLAAGQPGSYTVVVAAGSLPPARATYLISRAQVRRATPWDTKRADALLSYYAARSSYKKTRNQSKFLQDLRKVVPALERSALPKALRAYAWQELGLASLGRRQWQESAQSYGRAARLFHQLGMRSQEAVVLIGAGSAEVNIPSVDQAVKHLEQGLSLARSIRDEHTEAMASTHLGMFYAERIDAWNAKSHLDRAIAIREKSHDVEGECKALAGKAMLLRNLGEYEEALRIYQDELQRLKPGPQTRAFVLTELGNLYTLAGNPNGAFRYLKEALDLQKQGGGDLADQANTLIGFGFAYAAREDFSAALASYQRALAIYVSQNDPRSQAISLMNIGWVLGSLKRYDEAIDAFERAFSLAQGLKQPFLEGGALLGLAWTERLRGNLDAASSNAEEALKRIESTRSAIPDLNYRLAYFSRFQDAYDFLIRALMEQYNLQPSRNLLERALQVSESARSRNLLDTLGGRDGATVKRLAPVLDARQIQRQVLDPDTILLEYSLGQPKSYLLLVTPDEIERFELPPRDELETLAKDTHDALTDSQIPAERSRALRKATELSRRLLGPVAKRLGQKRLLIVTSGALQLVPFGALPDPVARVKRGNATSAWPEPLLRRHEILLEPSASVLAGIRKIRASRRPASGLLAVLADPVYERDDPRYPRAAGPKEGGSDPVLHHLDRLPASGEEAQAIATGLPAAKVLKALGFGAHRDLLTSGGLKDYGVLHIAAHNYSSEKNPASSALILSRYDSLGRPRNGLLRIKDVSTQDLRSDLVVLSACGSALGKQVRGEGIVGWPWAFLSAGASEVVMSFWDVGDTSTSELMKRFYKNMIQGMSPSNALREAQLQLWSEGKAPRVWGGFMAQGEWNIHPLSLNKAPSAVSSQDGDPRSPAMTRQSPPKRAPR